MASIVAIIPVHDDWYHLRAVIRALAGIPVICVVNKRPFFGPSGDWETSVRIALEEGAKVETIDVRGEKRHRLACLKIARDQPEGYTYAITCDADEVLEPKLRDALVAIAHAGVADVARGSLETYWQDCHHVVRPTEKIRPTMLVNLHTVTYLGVREYRGARDITLSPEFGVCHHLSWVRPASAVLRKLQCWGHRNEVYPNWLLDVFLAWPADPLMRHVHPTLKEAYHHIERIPKPEVLANAWDENPVFGEPELLGPVPPTAAIVALYGGTDIYDFLESIHPMVREPKSGGGKARKERETCPPLFEEVIVVDNNSPDGLADQVIARHPWAKVIKSETNLGFAGGSNLAVRHCSPTIEALFFFNSDDVVCRSGLVPAFNTLASASSIGAVGVMTNEAGYGHKVEVTPTQLEHLELFCRDFSHRTAEDADNSMLAMFALLMPKRLYDTLGGLDDKFYPALWEDTDLMYRTQRAKYRTVLSRKAFVHHKCSKSLGRMNEPVRDVMSRGERYYRRKHANDVECGFASHLAGDKSEPVQFDPSRHPEVFRAEIRRLAPVADIGLSIIAANNEAFIEDLCRSVEGVFTQKVAYLNNSTDGTRDILARYGFTILEGEFVDFAYARNQALAAMTTRWICFLDTDDVLPLMSAVNLLRSVVAAGPQVGGLRIPVQFPPEKGNTRVDHCKVVRRHPGLEWIYPIHEQIIQSLAPGTQVASVAGVYVLHQNYQNSPAEQAAKKERDWPLLDKAVRQFPECPFCAWCMGMTKEDDGQLEDAIVWLDRSISLSTPATSTLRKVYLVKARALSRQGKDAEAQATARQGLAIYPNDPELNYFLGIRLVDAGNAAEALERVAAMQTDTSDHYGSIDVAVLGPKRTYLHARALLGVGRYPESIEGLQQAASAGLEDAAKVLAEAALARRDFAVAEDALARLAGVSGYSEGWCDLRVRVSEAAGQDPEAILWAHVNQRPGEPAAFLVLSRRLLSRGLEQPAAPLLQALSDMGVAEGARNLGILHAAHGQLRRALACHRRALQIDPTDQLAAQNVRGLEAALASGAPDAEDDEEEQEDEDDLPGPS